MLLEEGAFTPYFVHSIIPGSSIVSVAQVLPRGAALVLQCLLGAPPTHGRCFAWAALEKMTDNAL